MVRHACQTIWTNSIIEKETNISCAIAELLKKARAGKKRADEELPALEAPSVYSKASDDGSYHDNSTGIDDASDASLLRDAHPKHRSHTVQKSGLGVSMPSEVSNSDWTTIFDDASVPNGEGNVQRAAVPRRGVQQLLVTWSLPTTGLVKVGNALMEAETGITFGEKKLKISAPLPMGRRPF